MIEIRITPLHKIILSQAPQAIINAFEISNCHGILHLFGLEDEQLSSELNYFKNICKEIVERLCLEDDLDNISIGADSATIYDWLQRLPPIYGGEYINDEFLLQLTCEIQNEIIKNAKKIGLREYLKTHFPNFIQVGNIYFHLAENKKSLEKPFAFFATFSSKVTKSRVKHMALGQAIMQFAKENKKVLTNLLAPIQNLCAKSNFIRELYESEKIFRPVPLVPEQAFIFLKELALYEKEGIVIRVPTWWNRNTPPRAKVKITIGEKNNHVLGLDALMDFNIHLAVGDEVISAKEWKEIVKLNKKLVFLKGQWVEVDQAAIQSTLDQWSTILSITKNEGIPFAQAMRLLGQSAITKDDNQFSIHVDNNWSEFCAGKDFLKKLEKIKSPEMNTKISNVLKKNLKTQLRPYQEKGLMWLWSLKSLGLGGCLADDMGLGKTIQVISLILLNKNENKNDKTLLIVPTSLLSNWQMEIEKFAPTLRVFFFHAFYQAQGQGKDNTMDQYDVGITTYGSVKKYDFLKKMKWDMIILDEAQSIKNPQAQQTKYIKELNCIGPKFVLTGTPVENRLSDLWSLFDFACPGLLGNKTEFTAFLAKKDFRPLRNLISPYILRRLKTDKSVIQDLPDKTEIKTYCHLTKYQATLYEQNVKELAKLLAKKDTSSIQRKGVILTMLMRFKQICNHPSLFLADGEFEAHKSGKVLRMLELVEEIAQRQEKVLIFTQFREMTDILDNYLEKAFNGKGLVLHGGTSIKQRKIMVEKFQQDNGPSYFVLSLKAGGVGLNLTQACHVIHFDRWWNPAVENQASDRAFRIGQKRNVLIHKFITKGTIEDKIDLIMDSKSLLSKEVIDSGEEIHFTNLSNEDIMNLVKLDITNIEEL